MTMVMSWGLILWKISAGSVGEGDQGKHDRHFDQNPDDGCQGSAGIKPEQADRHGHGKFKKV